MKMQSFQGDDGCGFEPMCGTAGIANGTTYSTGRLIAASICHGRPGPDFFAPWIYKYTTGGLKELLKVLPKKLSHGSLYCQIYSKFKFKFILHKFINVCNETAKPQWSIKYQTHTS